MSRPPDVSHRMAKVSFSVVLGGFLANSAFNLIMEWLGYGYPYTSFLFVPSDRWADFFKMLDGFPGEPVHPPVIDWPWQRRLDDFVASIDTLRRSGLNADHMPPLETLFAVIARRAEVRVDPTILFFLFVTSFVAWFCASLRAWLPDGQRDWRWIAVGLLSYPLIFMLDRGHVFSIACATLLLMATRRLVERGSPDWTTLLLYALACNIRPNVVIVPILLMLGGHLGNWRDGARLMLAGAAVLFVCMSLSHLLYPYYGWATWLRGLAEFYSSHVTKPITSGFTTSLPYVLGKALGKPAWIGPVCYVLGGLLGLGAVLACRSGRITFAQLAFLAVAIMPLVVPSFADYHLLAFFLPLMAMARAGGPSCAGDWLALIGTLAVLVPKNYLYGSDYMLNPWSWQVVVNPLILLALAPAILWLAFTRRETVKAPAYG